MDPHKAIRDLIEGLNDSDGEAVEESCTALIQWIDQRGFLPTREEFVELLFAISTSAQENL